MVYDKKGNFKGKADDIVETLARMNNDQREEFVESLVRKWPHMAQTIMDFIGFELMSKEEN
tara:strand:- start:3988 stop:4170 length:183 start_codon:yes stop_codon:yes gene_type:complete